MSNLSIQFENPWLLFLLIPAIAIVLIPYFRLNKRYRATRNRICSMILRLLVMLLSICVLAGLVFNFTTPNKENEIILVVDVSDTEERAADERDSFVEMVVNEAGYDHVKVGIVTFGYDYQYVVPLTHNTSDAYSKYLSAPKPDTTATNIASALSYAKDLFTKPETAKIVLVTDGKETDEEASKVIRSIAATGIKVDTACVNSGLVSDDLQFVNCKMPEYHVSVGDECEINISIQSNMSDNQTVIVELYDNGVINDMEKSRQEVVVRPGLTNITFKHTFKESDLHTLRFSMDRVVDGIEQNNEYYTHIFLQVFNKILMIETYEGQSTAFAEMLRIEDRFDVTVLNAITDELPQSVDELREYDQVIFNNVANADLPAGFIENIQEYVEDYGGALFTVGGNDESGNAHAYNRQDLRRTKYQDLLPVEAIDYTPPIGVMFLIDGSGSMFGSGDKNYFMQAVEAAEAASLYTVSERDYVGFIVFEDEPDLVLPMTPRVQEAKIKSAISTLKERTTGGSTMFGPSLRKAREELNAIKNLVDKLHIILISDGVPFDKLWDEGASYPPYGPIVKESYETYGIATSVIGINLNNDAEKQMQDLVKICEDPTGENYGAFQNVFDGKISSAIRQVLEQQVISEYKAKDFLPYVNKPVSPIMKDVDYYLNEEEHLNDNFKMKVSLGGYYGTKAKPDAEVILIAEYSIPLYAQWKYGKGMVGSLMTELTGEWSSEFMADQSGKNVLYNAIANIMPTTNIRPDKIRYKLTEDNYTNHISIFTELDEGQRLEGTIISVTDEGMDAVSMNTISEQGAHGNACYIAANFNEQNKFSRCTFVIREGGVYFVTINKVNEAGAVIETVSFYKSFAYSEEYDNFLVKTNAEYQESLSKLSEITGGTQIADLEDPTDIFKDFVTILHNEFDPRLLFAILSIVFFLLDIAVRKFKFKWPHELVREYKEKKMTK